MKIFLAAMIGIPALASCILSGIAHARQKVYGLPASALFGDAQKRYDVGLLPLAVLRTGVFSIIGVWAAFLLRLGITMFDAIFLGVAIGVLVSLFHTMLVWKISRSHQACLLIFLSSLGAILGEIVGFLGTRLLEIHESEFFFICSVMLSATIIGALLGAVNARKVNKKFTIERFRTIAIEPASGSISIGIVGLLLFYSHFKITQSPYYLCFSLHLSIVMGWVAGISVIFLHGFMYPWHRLIVVAIIRISNRSRLQRNRSLFRKVLFFLVIALTGGILFAALYSRAMLQVHPSLAVKRIFFNDRIHGYIPYYLTSSDGTYFVAGILPKNNRVLRLAKFSSDGALLWEDFLEGEEGWWQRYSYLDRASQIVSLAESPEEQYLIVKEIQRYTIFIFDGEGEFVKTLTIPFSSKDIEELFSIIGQWCVTPSKCYNRYQTSATVLKIFSDGSYLLGGGKHESWTIKFNSRGKRLWTQEVNCPSGGLEMIKSISDGGYLTVWDRGHQKRWVTRYNKDGRKVWRKTYQGKDKLLFKILSDGSHLVIGRFSLGEIEKNWMAKFDSEGKILWKDTIGDQKIDLLEEAESGALWALVSDNQESRIYKIDTNGRKIKEYIVNQKQLLMPIRFYVQSSALIGYVLAVNDFLFQGVEEILFQNDKVPAHQSQNKNRLISLFNNRTWWQWKRYADSKPLTINTDGQLMITGDVCDVLLENNERLLMTEYVSDSHFSQRCLSWQQGNIEWGLQFSPPYIDMAVE